MTSDSPQLNKSPSKIARKENKKNQRIENSVLGLGTPAWKGLRDFTHIWRESHARLGKKVHLFPLNYPQISPRTFEISAISILNAWLRIPMRIKTIWRQDKNLPKILIPAHLCSILGGFSQQRTVSFATNPAAQQINPISARWMSSLKALQGYRWMATREPWLLLIRDQQLICLLCPRLSCTFSLLHVPIC